MWPVGVIPTGIAAIGLSGDIVQMFASNNRCLTGTRLRPQADMPPPLRRQKTFGADMHDCE